MLTKDAAQNNIQQHLQESPRREESIYPWSPSFLPHPLSRFPLANLPYPTHNPFQMEPKQETFDKHLGRSLIAPSNVKQELSPNHLSHQSFQNNNPDNFSYKEVLIKQEAESKDANFDSLKKMMQRFGPSGMPEYPMFESSHTQNEYQAALGQQQKSFLSQQQKIIIAQQQQLHLKRSNWPGSQITSLLYHNPTMSSSLSQFPFPKNLDSIYNPKKFNIPSNFNKPPGFEEDSFNSSGEHPNQDEGAKLFPCRNCSFISSSKEEFEQHSRKHFKYSCSMCNYKSKSEGRLKRHLKHSHENQFDGDDNVNTSVIDNVDNENGAGDGYSFNGEENIDSSNNIDTLINIDNNGNNEADNNDNKVNVINKVSEGFNENESKSSNNNSYDTNKHDDDNENLHSNKRYGNSNDDNATDSNASNSPSKLFPLSDPTTLPDTFDTTLTNKTINSSHELTMKTNNDSISTTNTNVKSTSVNEETNSNKKLSKARVCKICGYVTYDKNDNYQHRSTHFPNMLKCEVPGCRFATQHRHHFLYHMKGHKGEKSYKCNKCNYSCLTRSMLVSHEKCHSYVYRYRCSTCKFSAKHAHALTVHIVKWNHEPAPVLRPDGSLPINDPSSNFENFVRKGRRNKQKTQMSLNSHFTPKKEAENGFGKFSSMYNSSNTSSSNAMQNVQHLQNNAYYQNLMAHRNMLMNMELNKVPPVPRQFLSFPFAPTTNPNFPPFKLPQQGSSVKCPQCHQLFENPLAYMNHAFTGQCIQRTSMNLERAATPEDSDSEDNHSVASNHFNQSFRSNEEADQNVAHDKRDYKNSFKNGTISKKDSFDGRNETMNGKKSDSALDLSAKKIIFTNFSDDDELMQQDITNKIETQNENDNTENYNHNNSDVNETKICINVLDTENIKQEENLKLHSKNGSEMEIEPLSPTSLTICSENGLNNVARKSRRKGIAHKLNLKDMDEEVESFSKNGQREMETNSENENDLNGRFEKVSSVNSNSEDVDDFDNREVSLDIIKTENNNSQMNIPSQYKLKPKSDPNYEQRSVSKIDQQPRNATNNPSETEHNKTPKSTQQNLVEFDTGEPTFHCLHCQIAFGDKRIYNIHMQFHKPDDPFSCQLCGREYSDGREFFLHVAQFEHHFKPSATC